MTSECEHTPVPATLGARIDRLFEALRPPDAPERAWTNREVSTACRSAKKHLSESHLSELRRGVKTNPTVQTLGAIAWFFNVRAGYFNDEEVAESVERELIAREAELHATIAARRDAQAELRAATAELQAAMREAGVAKVAHRNGAGAAREQASMMRALAHALTEDDDADTDAADGAHP